MLHFYVTAKQDNNLEQNPKLSLNFSLVITETHSVSLRSNNHVDMIVC